MNDTLIVRTFAPHEWPTYKDLRLRALADSPDAFGSTLAAEQGRTDAGDKRRGDHKASLSSSLHIRILWDTIRP